MLKKIIIFLGIFLAAVLAGSYFLIRSVPPKEPKVFGITFSEPFAKELGLDWKKAYEEIFSDLGVKNVRLPVYWSEVEPEKEKWHFEDIDWQIAKAEKYGAKFLSLVGQAEVETALMQGKQAEAGLAAARAQLAQARAGRKRHDLKTTISGTVIDAPDNTGGLIGPGMPVGPTRPHQTEALKSGMPCSSKVARSGNCGERFRPVMPAARNCPVRMNCVAPSWLLNISWTWPAIRSVYTWAPPR